MAPDETHACFAGPLDLSVLLRDQERRVVEYEYVRAAE